MVLLISRVVKKKDERKGCWGQGGKRTNLTLDLEWFKSLGRLHDFSMTSLETGIRLSLINWHCNPFLLGFVSSLRTIVQSLSSVRLCDPMDYSTSGFPVLHDFPEFAQTHVHWVGDAIQPSHPLSFPSPPAFDLSQHPCLFQFFMSEGQSIGVSASASVLLMNIQDWSPLGWTG